MPKYAVGIDYGTNSCRALLVDITSGTELSSFVYHYPAGEAGILLDPKDPNLARQSPADYLKGFEMAVKEVLMGIDAADVVGVGIDTTGSSPMPIDAEGRALSMLPEFEDNLAAYCWLWKDHTSYLEAAEITEKAAAQGLPYLAKCGGTYSSEWFWSKILKCARVAPDVFAAAYSWVEYCDWLAATITGNAKPEKIVRSICAAGHKAMFHTEWGGLPSKEFLSSLDPRLADLRDRLYTEAFPVDHPAGTISAEWAEKTGLKEGTPVAVAAFDAHLGAVASGAKPGVLVKIIGTSTCDCMVYPLDQPLADVPGLCGIVPGSVVPGYYGLEAGQSAVGDIFNWVSRFTGKSHDELTAEALKLAPGESGLVALDWHNGNRTILVDPLLTGAFVGLTLYTTPAEAYRAAIEATAFGALKIINRLEEYGVKVEEVVNCGGIAEKSALTMQIYADVTNRPMKIAKAVQTCALGSAIAGSVVGGEYKSIEDAQAVMAGTKEIVYTPNPEAVAVYAELFEVYTALHDGLGKTGKHPDLEGVMKKLIAIRSKARA